MSEGKLKNCHCEEERSPDVSISAILFILLIPFSAHATCTPTPDCASIGYTETSCEGASLKCPFDTSKLYCVSCDSSFKYDCVGDNIVSSVGEACGNKYVICECVAGATFINGSCICDTSCSVGNIYYSDKTCSSCLDNSKTPIGIVVKDNELVMSRNRNTVMPWSNNYTNVSGITDTKDLSVAITDFNGKTNTLAMLDVFTNDTVDDNTAVYCNSYTTEGTNAGDWYLPAAGELYSYVYGNYSKLLDTWKNKLAWNTSFSYDFWSSSEKSANDAWVVRSSNGYMINYYKNYNYSVSCFLAIN